MTSTKDIKLKDFEYSTKNIPLASKNAYLQVLIAKTESLIQRMRCKAFFFLNKNCNDTSKESYGFKSKRSPPHVAELNEFEGCMLEMIQRVEFRTNTYSNDLQKKLNKDVKEIQEEHNIFVKADKTTNYYKTAPASSINASKIFQDFQQTHSQA